MKTIKNERVIPCDVDGTLVIHNPGPGVPLIDVIDPETGRPVTLGINRSMVKLVREEKFRGAFILVWSRGGYAWAKNVINALHLENHVDLIMTKPMAYFDDIPVEEWLETRIFLDENTVYKR